MVRSAVDAGRETGRAARGTVALLELLAGAAGALVVAPDSGVLVVGVADRAADLGLPALVVTYGYNRGSEPAEALAAPPTTVASSIEDTGAGRARKS